MKIHFVKLFLVFVLIYTQSHGQLASFTIPDTVCVNTPITIQNTSTGGNTFYWNFCSGSLYNDMTLTQIPNIDNAIGGAFGMTLAEDNNNHYLFITNHFNGLVRYDFGSSYLNTPTVTSIGNFNGVLDSYASGIQIIKDGGGWHAIIVAGIDLMNTQHIVKLDFGASLSNNNPVITDWGNIGNLSRPFGLFVTEDGGNYYGFTANIEGKYENTLVRFDFGPSISQQPVATNLGNIGDLWAPHAITAVKEKGNWHMFITNEGNGISRLDFGNTLANMPTGVSFTHTKPILSTGTGITMIHECGNIQALVLSMSLDSVLFRFDFGNDITSTFGVSDVKLSPGSLKAATAISSIFKEGDNRYFFVLNAAGNNITRVALNSCTNSSIPSSSLKNPPVISYNKPGLYNVSLIMDESLPTQSSYCKTIVVVDDTELDLGKDQTICYGTSVTLDAGAGAAYYKWSTGAVTSAINVSSTGTYAVEVSKGRCIAKDTIHVTVSDPMVLSSTVRNIDCNNMVGRITITVNGGTLPYTYFINNISSVSNTFENLPVGTYSMLVTDSTNCKVEGTATVIEDLTKILKATARTTPVSCNGDADGAISVQVTAGTPPYTYSIDGTAYQSAADFDSLPAGNYTVSIRSDDCAIEVPASVATPAALLLDYAKTDDYCEANNGTVTLKASGGTIPYSYAWNNMNSMPEINNLTAGTYIAAVKDNNGCETETPVTIDAILLPPVTILNNDTTINIGETLQLHAVNAVDYSWTPAGSLSCADCADPVARPLDNTTYTVTTVTGKNCIKEDQLTVYVTKNQSLFVPTAFTPNGDGVNDKFVVKSKGVATYSIRIFNRWGELIFLSNNTGVHWDGKYMGQLQERGSYVYILTYRYYGREDKELMQKGSVTLVR